jgi:hypothetical protein
MASIQAGMKTIIAFSLAAALLASAASTAVAQVSTNTPPPNGGTQTNNLHNMTPQERKAYLQSHPELAKQLKQRHELMRILGLNPKDLKELTPAERREKIKEAAEAKLADLKQKKESGTLTSQEQTDLELLRNFLNHGHAKPKTNPSGS